MEDMFVELMHNHMSMVMVRYFEYSLTAGLFLVSVLITMYPSADAYMYQILYQGMMMCNLVAIPITKGIVGAVKTHEFLDQASAAKVHMMYGQWVPAGLGMILAASMLFFIAAFVPFSTTVMPLIGSEGVPTSVKLVVIIILIIFLLFALVGLVTIGRMIAVVSNSAQQEATKGEYIRQIRKWMDYQLVAYELLNWGKWGIAIGVVGGVLASIGLK